MTDIPDFRKYRFQSQNRLQAKKPRYGMLWCPSCDRYYGFVNDKCRVCGKKMFVKKKLKKET